MCSPLIWSPLTPSGPTLAQPESTSGKNPPSKNERQYCSLALFRLFFHLFWGPLWQCLPEAAQRRAQGVPKASQRRPQGVPKASQGVPKASQRRPKASKGVLRRPQGVPKACQGVPKASRRRLKASRCVPRRPKGVPKTSKGVREAPQCDEVLQARGEIPSVEGPPQCRLRSALGSAREIR